MKALLRFFFCVVGVTLLIAAEPIENDTAYASNISIALADNSIGRELSKMVLEMDFTLRRQLQMAPLITKTNVSDMVISDRDHIEKFFSALWRPTDLTSKWSGPNCSVAIRLAMDNGKTAYFHVYFFNGKVPHITPWTDYDSASYTNASLLTFFKEIGYDIQNRIKSVSDNSVDSR